MPDRAITEMDEVECLKLISPGGIGRIAVRPPRPKAISEAV